MSERSLLVNANKPKLDEDIRPSNKRWFLALLLIINTFIICFITFSFVIAKKVFVQYFQLPFVAVEWFFIIQQPGIIVGFIGIGLFGYGYNYGFRPLSIVAGFLSVVSNVLLQISITFSKAFILIYVTQFLNGICFALLRIMSTQLAKRWFPQNQNGIALSFFIIACASATTLAYTLPSHVLNIGHNYNNSISLDYINVPKSDTAWHDTIKTRLYYFYSPLIPFLVITWVLFMIFSEDKPIKPPSIAQLQIRTKESQSPNQWKNLSVVERIKVFFTEFQAIMSDKIILQATLVETIRSSISITQGIFMGEILAKLITGSSGDSVAIEATAYALLIYEVSLLIGSVFSGLILDYYGKHVVEATTALIMFFVFNIGIAVAYIFKSIYLIYIFNAFVGFSSGLAVICVFDIAFHHLHPINPGFVNLSMGIAKYIGLAILFQITRIILVTGGGLYVFIFQSILLIFSIIDCSMIRVRRNLYEQAEH